MNLEQTRIKLTAQALMGLLSNEKYNAWNHQALAEKAQQIADETIKQLTATYPEIPRTPSAISLPNVD